MKNASIDLLRSAVESAFEAVGASGLPEAGGIYVMTNRTSRRVYVGKTTNLLSRARNHMAAMKAGRHNEFVCADFIDNGADSFGFYLVHECGEDGLAELERAYIRIASEHWPCANIVLKCDPVSNSQRQKALRQRRKASGKVHVPVWLHRDDVEAFKQEAAEIMAAGERERAARAASAQPA